MSRTDLSKFNNSRNCEIDLTVTNTKYFGYPHNCHNVIVILNDKVKYTTEWGFKTIEDAFRSAENGNQYITFKYLNISTIQSKIDKVKQIKKYNDEHVNKLVIYPEMTNEEIDECLQLINTHQKLLSDMANYNAKVIKNKSLYNDYLELFK